MASNRIKGITIEIGGDTTKLDKALGGVDHNLYTIQKDLKAVEAALKLNPGNTELLAQKQRLLGDAVTESAKRLDVLSEAAKSANQALAEGKISTKQYNNLSLETSLAEASLEQAKKALSDFNDELNQTDGPAGDAADSIEELKDAADGAGDGLSGIGRFSEGAASSLGLADIAAGGAAFAIGEKLVEALVAAGKELWEFDEKTKEFREAMGKLNAAAGAAGYSTEEAKETYQDFYKILGDTDTATEASQLLLNMEKRESKLNALNGVLSKSFVYLGNSIPVDKLLESINLAAQTGEVTGTLAEVLGKAGISTEQFEQDLAEMYESAKNGEGTFNSLSAVTGKLSESLFDSSEDAGEASRLFMELANTQSDLAAWTDVAAGVYGTFGDSLPIEGLIEAANETAQVGKVTGVLADALNWAGISEDDFNEALDDAGESANRARLIVDTLARTYSDATEEFYKSNEAIMENRESQAQLDDKTAELGQTVADMKAEMETAFAPLEELKMSMAMTALEKMTKWFVEIGDAVQAFNEWLVDAVNSLRKFFGVAGQYDEHWNITSGGTPVENYFPTSSGYSLRTATAEDLPHLAQGAVTRANSPFLAVVGDNPQEPEVISPLSTIKQAVMEANAASGGGSGAIQVFVNFGGDLAQLARVLQPHITAETQRRGPQLTT